VRRLAFISLLLITSCATQKLTLVTYNVGAFGKYMESSVPQAAAFLREVKADAVCLNELDSCNRRHNVYQLEDLAFGMGMEYAFAKALDFAGGSYGNGIMTAECILYSDIIPLPAFGGYEPRCVAVVETKDYVIACTHLDFKNEEASLGQVEIINKWFTEKYSGYGKPVILCGDMNAIPGSATISALETCWTRISPDGYTYSTEDPRKCIDHIFFLTAAKAVTVRKTFVAKGQGLESVSDHFPVVARIRWR